MARVLGQVKLCDPIVTHGPYLNALEITLAIIKRYRNGSFIYLLYLLKRLEMIVERAVGDLMQEVVSALSDLKQGVEELRRSKTFKYVLATLLSVGNCLNNMPVCMLIFSVS